MILKTFGSTLNWWIEEFVFWCHVHLKYLCTIYIFVDPAAGASDDWYKGVLKARFAYTIELRDTGRHGFVLPADQIKPSGEELWEAQRVVLQKMVDISSEEQ